MVQTRVSTLPMALIFFQLFLVSERPLWKGARPRLGTESIYNFKLCNSMS